MKPSRYILSFSLFFIFGVLPQHAQATVRIIEIMYDVPGTDTGREWFEVVNTGSDSIDLTTYKLFEATTNHAISAVSGSGTLVPGGVAVIADDAAKFMADWPSYSGTLLKSSFSFSNSGETFSLKDSSLSVVDTVTYDTSVGAAGDGTSLHRTGGTFVVAAADPGVNSGSDAVGTTQTTVETQTTPVTSASTTQVTTQQSAVPQSGGSGPPIILGRITATPVVTVGAGSFMSSAAYSPSGEIQPLARSIWNFGDGATAEGQTVFHTYQYPGKYVVILTVTSGLSAGMSRTVVEAVPAEIGLLHEPDGSVTLSNQSTKDLNIGLWSITSGTSTFVIPQNTTVLGGQSVRFGTGIMGMTTGEDATLRYANNVLAASAANGVGMVPQSTLGAPAHAPVAYSAIPVVSAVRPVALPATSVPAPSVPVFASTTNSDLAASAGEAGGRLPPWVPFVGLCGLLLVAVVGSFFLHSKEAAPVTSFAEDEFEIE